MQKPRGLRVLVVQNHPESPGPLAVALGSAGHEVEVAADGSPALEAARLSRPAVVFLDSLSDRRAAYLSARRICDDSAWRRPLLVALGENDDAQAAEVGIDLHLPNPVDIPRLLIILGRFQAILDEVEGFDPVI